MSGELQTYEEWADTMFTSAFYRERSNVKQGWDACRKNSELIAKKQEEKYRKAHKKDTSLCYTFHDVADICNEIAEEISKL